ncbi:hypothetical protein LINGRAHAP2_LOCUS12564 [Linum grandiflorum]
MSNADGNICDGRSGLFFRSALIVAEVRVILELVFYASHLTNHVVIHSNCQVLVNCLKRPSERWLWECYGYLGSISILLRSMPNIKLTFSPTRRNKRADWVARNTRLGSLPPEWIDVIKTLFLDD